VCYVLLIRSFSKSSLQWRRSPRLLLAALIAISHTIVLENLSSAAKKRLLAAIMCSINQFVDSLRLFDFSASEITFRCQNNDKPSPITVVNFIIGFSLTAERGLRDSRYFVHDLKTCNYIIREGKELKFLQHRGADRRSIN
jgi:hypothetical protein